MEEYGGLIKRMPYTAVFFLIGAIAISGLPPLNGFVSEWLTFQSIFAGIASQSMLIKSIFIFAGASLAFTGGLAAACFVKAFGITFLARPRSIESETAKESSPLFTISMGFLALLCLLISIFSFSIIQYLQLIVKNFSVFSNHSFPVTRVTGVNYLPYGSIMINMPLLIFSLLFSIIITLGFVYI